MTIDQLQNQRPTMEQQTTQQQPPVSVQNEVQKEILKQTMGQGSNSQQRQLMQLISSAQPMFQIQQTAQNQISKGYLDIKI